MMELSQANRLTLNDILKGRGRMRGKFLLVRTRSPPQVTGTAMLGTIVSVLDPEESRFSGKKAEYFIRLMNYFFCSSLNHDSLPTGTYLALKNPDPKKLLVWDNPRDVQLLSHKEVMAIMGEDFTWPYLDEEEGEGSPKHPFWSGLELAADSVVFEKLRRNGNKLFVFQQWSDAIRFYDLALQYAQTDEDKSMTLSNKAAALIRFGCSNTAKEVAKLALDVNPGNKKALHRLGQALVRLGKYEDAVGELEDRLGKLSLPEEDEKTDSLQELLEEAKERKNAPPAPQDYVAIIAAKVGLCQVGLEIKKMKTSAAEWKRLTDKLNDYVGPVEVRRSQSYGRDTQGLFATEDISPGQVLLVSRPICRHSCKDVVSGNCDLDLMARITNMVHFEPTLAPLFNQLSSDDDHDPQHSFVDVTMIPKSFRYNSGNSSGWCAINPLPSYINHSCSGSNVDRETFGEGDLVIVKAMEKVAKGSELFIRFVDASLPIQERQKLLETQFDVTCSCNLCKWQLKERHTEVGRRYRKLVELLTAGMEYEGSDDFSPFATRCIRRLISDMDFLEGLWNDLKIPRLLEFRCLQNCAKYIKLWGQREGKLEVVKSALKVYKFAVAVGTHGEEKTIGMMTIHYTLEYLKLEEEMLDNLRALKEEVLLWYGDLEEWRRHITPAGGFEQHLTDIGIDFFSL